MHFKLAGIVTAILLIHMFFTPKPTWGEISDKQTPKAPKRELSSKY